MLSLLGLQHLESGCRCDKGVGHYGYCRRAYTAGNTAAQIYRGDYAGAAFNAGAVVGGIAADAGGGGR